ncbi:PKD domain-containing protein [Chloroflexota bacterium]
MGPLIRQLVFIVVILLIAAQGCSESEPDITLTLPPPTVAPNAQISVVTPNVKIAQNVPLSGTGSSDTDGRITYYEWDFGDGNTASGVDVTHAYTMPGRYTVRLTVTDDTDLSDTAELVLRVSLGVQVQTQATSSTWRSGDQPYPIHNAVKEKLEMVGFEVVNGGLTYDLKLLVDFKEQRGAPYYGGGYGTNIACLVRLYNEDDSLLFSQEIAASTDSIVSSPKGKAPDLYGNAIRNFEDNSYFVYLGEIVANECGMVDEVSILISALEGKDERARDRAAWALGHMEDNRAVEPLIKALNGDDMGLQYSAIISLGQLGDQRAIEHLTRLLEELDGSEYIDYVYAIKTALANIEEQNR